VLTLYRPTLSGVFILTHTDIRDLGALPILVHGISMSQSIQEALSSPTHWFG